MSSSDTFHIHHWNAWAPGIESREAWLAWPPSIESREACLSTPPEDEQPQTQNVPNVRFVPAILRRRLSRLSKMALFVAHHCIQEAPAKYHPKRYIFASRHGELHRTVRLLESIAQKEPISPTQFSLSVHNTAAGLFSIAHQDKSPTTAISARQDTFLYAMIEAMGWLHFQPDEPILVVMADEPLPTTYQDFIDEDEMSYAVAFLLTKASDVGGGDSIEWSFRGESETERQIDKKPQALTFLKWLVSDEKTLRLNTQQGTSWNWNKDEQTY